jgi:hypothetical protein
MMLPGWGFAGPAVRQFEEQYHCYSVAAADKAHLEVSYTVKVFFCGCVGNSSISSFAERRQDTVTAVGL